MAVVFKLNVADSNISRFCNSGEGRQLRKGTISNTSEVY
jgi:hypothetical protein